MNYVSKNAHISLDGQYRYTLEREWDTGHGACVFIGLNPSTADAKEDDPTIRRCVAFAKAWGYKRLVMVNAYAFRVTDPKHLKKITDPVGQVNDIVLRGVCREAKMVVACWGNNIERIRQDNLLLMLDNLHVLRLTKKGFPAHPLYLPGNLTPVVWDHYLRF